MIYYLIVGKSNSGKTTARRYLERRGFAGYEASEFMKKRLASSPGADAAAILEQCGKDIIARDILSALSNTSPSIISGFRTPEEISYIRNAGSTRVIALQASDEICYARCDKSALKRFPNLETFIQHKLDADDQLGLRDVLTKADVTIENTEGLDIFYHRLDHICTLDLA